MKREKFTTITKLFLILFFAFSILFPIIKIFSNISIDAIKQLVVEQQFKESLINSITVTFFASIISFALAYVLAYAVNRSNIKFKKIFTLMFTIPMLIPSISHGIGLINLFGANGIFTKLFDYKFDLFGFNGILIGSILYSFPVAFLIFSNSFKYLDNTLYELGDVVGMSKFQKFKQITFHYMKKSFISAFFAVFTMIFTDYGVPLAVGGKFITLPYYLYKEVIGLLNFSNGAIIGLFLLIPAIISFLIDTFVKETNNLSSVTKECYIPKNKLRDTLMYIISIIVTTFLVILLGSFIYLAFVKEFSYDMSFSLSHVEYILSNDALINIKNSIIISLFVSIIGTIIAFLCAYFSARVKSISSKFIHIISITTLAIPGIVLGLSYVFAFNGTIIYNTFIILIIVNIVHFFASPYLMAYNSLTKLNDKYEEVGLTCGINKVLIIKDVIVPNSYSTICEMLNYFFVNSMITISAITFLYNISTMPASLLINKYDGYLMLEEAALISIIILIINIIFKVITKLLFKVRKNKNELQSV